MRKPVAGIMALALASNGCSLLFMDAAPQNHAKLAYFDCTSSIAAPVLDTIWAGLNGIGAATASGPNSSSTVAVGLGWLAISGAAAIYGYQKAGACREAKQALQTRMELPPPGHLPAGLEPAARN